MDYEIHRAVFLEWLPTMGGCAKIVSRGLQVPLEGAANLKVSFPVSPRNKICPDLPLMPGIFNDSSFRVYENAEGEWLCPTRHRKGHTVMLSEAAKRMCPPRPEM